jgi:acyl-coenzyme A thioesterase PaaI-like protein
MATLLEFAEKMVRGEAPPPPIGRFLGFVLKPIEPGRAVVEMETDERHRRTSDVKKTHPAPMAPAAPRIPRRR